MKIDIGPYKSWIGPYQIASLGEKIGISHDRCWKFGEWLADTWVNSACQWIESKKKRRVKIHIDPYDTWNMNDTLALIILPMLKQLNEKKHGAPYVEDEDVPEGLGLRSTEADPKENDYDTDSNHFKRWDWVMNEMIWGFEQVVDPDDEEQFWKVHPELDFADYPEDEGKVTIPVRWKVEGECDWDGMRAHQARIQNAMRLFGVYFRNLWD